MPRHKNGTSTASQAERSPNEEIVAIEELMGDLEKRLQRLNSAVKREATGATGDVSDFIDEALGGVTERLRETARTLAHSMTDEAARVGADTLKRIGQEIDNRPFALLGLAAGIGFLLGMASRRA
jgi:ElaB/YqjD/DUF883 family membrane-anchored ribosome-binding protein